jgi:large subunit ribosomal protein L15
MNGIVSISVRKNKRLGRGHGSGKVKTSGRGTKGQNARLRMKRGFEGGQLPLSKRFPMLRGKFRNASQQVKAFPIMLKDICLLPLKEAVTMKSLKKAGIIDSKIKKVKVLFDGSSVTRKFVIEVPISGKAGKLITDAGGTINS